MTILKRLDSKSSRSPFPHRSASGRTKELGTHWEKYPSGSGLHSSVASSKAAPMSSPVTAKAHSIPCSGHRKVMDKADPVISWSNQKVMVQTRCGSPSVDSRMTRRQKCPLTGARRHIQHHDRTPHLISPRILERPPRSHRRSVRIRSGPSQRCSPSIR